jgi:protein-L-isoaspartate(D-aspartate) O-methyltransferase
MSWRDLHILLQAPEQHRPQNFLVLHNPLEISMTKPVLGMVSSRARVKLVQYLIDIGIKNSIVLSAMQTVERHLFVDTALASRAYEDLALPIGFKQTISQPSVVATMLSLACDATVTNGTWLEIGTGCGYQAAVMAQCTRQVCSIERVEGLYLKAKKNLAYSASTYLCLGDGTRTWYSQNDGITPVMTQFDAIIVAAAGINALPVWLKQLNIGGRLILPLKQGDNLQLQHLHMIERLGESDFIQHTLQPVQFVPLLSGTV